VLTRCTTRAQVLRVHQGGRHLLLPKRPQKLNHIRNKVRLRIDLRLRLPRGKQPREIHPFKNRLVHHRTQPRPLIRVLALPIATFQDAINTHQEEASSAPTEPPPENFQDPNQASQSCVKPYKQHRQQRQPGVDLVKLLVFIPLIVLVGISVRLKGLLAMMLLGLP